MSRILDKLAARLRPAEVRTAEALERIAYTLEEFTHLRLADRADRERMEESAVLNTDYNREALEIWHQQEFGRPLPEDFDVAEAYRRMGRV